jgi:hypothetical protein
VKLPINNDNNGQERIDFDSLEKKIMEEVKASAEVQRQKMIIKGQLDQENTKMMSQMMHNMNKSQLYGLNEQERIELMQQTQQVEHNNCPLNNAKKSFAKGKEKLTIALVVIIMLVLAIGVTPSGAWFEAIQTSYVELIVDFFRVGLLGVGGYLVYKLVKKD